MCIRYTGRSIPELGVQNGDYLHDVLVKIMSAFVDLMTVNVAIPNSSGGQQRVSLKEGIYYAINGVSNLDGANIDIGSGWSSILGTQGSIDTAKIGGKYVDYNITPTVSGSLLSFDLGAAMADMPQGYIVTKTTTIVTGRKVNGNDTVVTSSMPSFSADVANDRYPLNVEIVAKVQTPSGNVEMIGNIYIDSPKSGSYTYPLEVKDLAKSSGAITTLSGFAESIASSVQKLNVEMGKLKNLDLPNTQNMNIGKNDIATVLPVIVSKLDSLSGS